ncbi:hypothetical protein ZYGR_0Z02330 [Zygosaccharomyces rouxii]|uniref:Uncharacterized protein n=1 Tax=Zygosaccharomyces rouxii TaxID=4956 RepID=A0A1Q3A5G1_ZYGRO|nr:hypothetical protein ZYGR_0Z02330 [Zygosaccharomyces rouxii]
MHKDNPRWELRSVLRACSIFLIAAIIIKTWVPLDWYYHWTSNGRFSHLIYLFNLLRTNPQSSSLIDSARPIAEPQFDVSDANPFDLTRLICFITICVVLAIPFLL